MVAMSESHEGRALELGDIRLIRMRQILDERCDIGSGVRVRWAKIVVVRIAERVARDRARMEHAKAGVVKADGPAAHFQPACVAPAHELAKDVSALKDDLRDLGLDHKPFPARRHRVKIDRAVLGKVDLSLWASRLKKAAGVIGGRETDRVDAGAVSELAERRIVPNVENVPGVCPHRPMHSLPFRMGLPPAKLSARADVKPPALRLIDSVDSPRIVVKKRGLLGVGKFADDRLEAVEDRIEARP